MQLQRRTVAILITAATLALAGLSGLQVVLLRDAFRQKEQAFQRNVYAALSQAAGKLETREAMDVTMRFAPTPPFSHESVAVMVTRGADIDSCPPLNLPSARITSEPALPIRLEGQRLTYDVAEPQHIKVRVFRDPTDTGLLVVDSFREAGRYEVDIPLDLGDGSVMNWVGMQSMAVIVKTDHDSNQGMFWNSGVDSTRLRLVHRVVEDLRRADREPIDRRLRVTLLDTLVGQSFREAQIDLPFVFAVQSWPDDSLRLVRGDTASVRLADSPYRVRLFGSDPFSGKHELLVGFPGREAYLWKQVGPLVGGSILFMLVIVFCFIYSIRTLLEQRRFAGSLVDFINNMTHEFKTPLSTVSLASQALLRPDIQSDPERLGRYNQMIMDENRRMRSQVDKILQMAVLEEGDYELSRQPLHLNELVRTVVESFRLHVEHRQGSLSLALRAQHDLVHADSVHLAGVLHNVLDNANKYSPDAPRVELATRDLGNAIELTVSDHGIGLDRDDARRVFEKYYRVQTGNRHDVKGFGLGLAYVKLIVAAHGGTVSLASRLGEGTTVTIILPRQSEIAENRP